MPTPTIRDFFPGGNTSRGFHSFYDQIIPADARRILIIKGGPGVGKSSFMRSIAEEMAERGFATELMHCSSDNGSLDGVVFPKIGVALIDGTAPHVVDPKHPGCVDEIVNLGEYWDEAGITAHKEAILRTNREVGREFARAYRFLRAAREIREAMADTAAARLNPGWLNQVAAELGEEIHGRLPVASRPGRIRRLFASAFTPDGPRHFLPSIFAGAGKLFILRGRPGAGRSALLGKLAAAAAERGLMVEEYRCGFDPGRVEHLYLPEPGLGLISANEYHDHRNERASLLDLDDLLEQDGSIDEERYGADRALFDGLIQRAVLCLNGAKKLHDRMEEYYVPYMDFRRIGILREKTLERLMAYAGEVADSGVSKPSPRS